MLSQGHIGKKAILFQFMDHYWHVLAKLTSPSERSNMLESKVLSNMVIKLLPKLPPQMAAAAHL